MLWKVSCQIWPHLCTGHVTITAESSSCKNLGQLVAEFCNCQFGKKSLCPSLTVQATRPTGISRDKEAGSHFLQSNWWLFSILVPFAAIQYYGVFWNEMQLVMFDHKLKFSYVDNHISFFLAHMFGFKWFPNCFKYETPIFVFKICFWKCLNLISFAWNWKPPFPRSHKRAVL